MSAWILQVDYGDFVMRPKHGPKQGKTEMREMRSGDGRNEEGVCSDITSPSRRFQLPISASSGFFGQMERRGGWSASATPINFEFFVVGDFFIVVHENGIVVRA